MKRHETPENRFVQSGDVSIVCHVVGEGARDFVMVPEIISNIAPARECPDLLPVVF